MELKKKGKKADRNKIGGRNFLLIISFCFLNILLFIHHILFPLIPIIDGRKKVFFLLVITIKALLAASSCNWRWFVKFFLSPKRKKETGRMAEGSLLTTLILVRDSQNGSRYTYDEVLQIVTKRGPLGTSNVDIRKPSLASQQAMTVFTTWK